MSVGVFLFVNLRNFCVDSCASIYRESTTVEPNKDRALGHGYSFIGVPSCRFGNPTNEPGRNAPTF